MDDDSPNGRGGIGTGDKTLHDHMFLDGLEDAETGRLMGSFAEECADKYSFSREAQDEFAITSLKRAQEATTSGAFESEIIPVTVKSRKADTVVMTDESPFNARIDKIPTLRPAFRKDGTRSGSEPLADDSSFTKQPKGEQKRRPRRKN